MGGGLESPCIRCGCYLVASSWHFKLFDEDDARSNNPPLITLLLINFYMTLPSISLIF